MPSATWAEPVTPLRLHTGVRPAYPTQLSAADGWEHSGSPDRFGSPGAEPRCRQPTDEDRSPRRTIAYIATATTGSSAIHPSDPRRAVRRRDIRFRRASGPGAGGVRQLAGIYAVTAPATMIASASRPA